MTVKFDTINNTNIMNTHGNQLYSAMIYVSQHLAILHMKIYVATSFQEKNALY